MKKRTLISVLGPIFFLIEGCGIEPGLSGKARSEYLKTIKPYLEYWGKTDMTIEGRRLDSWSCGTAPTFHAAEHVVFSNESIISEQKKGERDYQLARERLRMKWVECMKDKGYVWVKE